MFYLPGIFTCGQYHTSCGQEKCVKKLPDEWHSVLWSHWSYPRYGQNGLRHEGSHSGPWRPTSQASSRSPQHWWLPAHLQVCTAAPRPFRFNHCVPTPILQVLSELFVNTFVLYLCIFILWRSWTSGIYFVSNICTCFGCQKIWKIMHQDCT